MWSTLVKKKVFITTKDKFLQDTGILFSITMYFSTSTMNKQIMNDNIATVLII